MTIFNMNVSWYIPTTCRVLAVFFTGINLNNLFLSKKPKNLETELMDSINNADKLLENNMFKDAIVKYNELLKYASIKNEPDIYCYIKNNKGICYHYLGIATNNEENLIKAIQVYDEFLKISTIQKFPVDYAIVKNNLGNAHNILSKFRNSEEHLIKAIQAYVEALEIFSGKKYPFNYAMVQNNLGVGYRNLSQYRNSEKNLEKAKKKCLIINSF